MFTARFRSNQTKPHQTKCQKTSVHQSQLTFRILAFELPLGSSNAWLCSMICLNSVVATTSCIEPPSNKHVKGVSTSNSGHLVWCCLLLWAPATMGNSGMASRDFPSFSVAQSHSKNHTKWPHFDVLTPQTYLLALLRRTYLFCQYEFHPLTSTPSSSNPNNNMDSSNT